MVNSMIDFDRHVLPEKGMIHIMFYRERNTKNTNVCADARPLCDGKCAECYYAANNQWNNLPYIIPQMFVKTAKV